MRADVDRLMEQLFGMSPEDIPNNATATARDVRNVIAAAITTQDEQIEDVIVWLDVQARRFAAANEGLSTADPQAWWVLTSGEILKECADHMRRVLARARKAYKGDGPIKRANQALCSSAPETPTSPKGQD